jgi:hypothetical protein
VKVTRIAAARAVRTRYIINCVISGLFRDEQVLLVSLDPRTDPFSAEIGNLRGRAHHPDHDKLPRDSGAVGENLTYVCWAPTFGHKELVAEDCRRLVSHLSFDSSVTPRSISWRRPVLVVIDGCQFLTDPSLKADAERIRDFIRACVANGHQVIAAGESDWDTEWLDEALDSARVMPPHGATGFRQTTEFRPA